MATLKIYRYDGRESGDLTVKEGIFDAEISPATAHRAHVAHLANMRQGNAATKTRGDVAGTGAKPWRQKGTGRARAGNKQSPVWRHGGVAHGPHPRDIELKVPKKMKRKALVSALTARANEDRIHIVDEFPIEAPKTKEVVGFLARHDLTGKVLLVTEKMHEALLKSSANLQKVSVQVASDLSLDDVLDCDTLVFTKDAVRALEERLGQ